MSVDRYRSLTRGRLASRHGQKGLGMIGSLLVILVGGLLLTCAIKMIPIYFQNWNIQSILNDLEPEFADVGTVTKKAIENKLSKRLNIDMISAIKVNDIEIKKIKGVFKITANYEKRIHIIGNVDIVMAFDNNSTTIPVRGM